MQLHNTLDIFTCKMISATKLDYISLHVLIFVSPVVDATLNCDEQITVSQTNTSLMVSSSSVSRLCVQCVDGNSVSSPSTIWTGTANGIELNFATSQIDPSAGVISILNGMLVISQPLNFLMDGAGFSLQCISPSLLFSYDFQLTFPGNII